MLSYGRNVNTFENLILWITDPLDSLSLWSNETLQKSDCGENYHLY